MPNITLDFERILSHDITILTGHRNEGKTMTLANIMTGYIQKYHGQVWAYGIKQSVMDNFPMVKRFYSIREMEKITDSIIIADEAGDLLNVVNRKQHEEMLRTLRLVSHSNNIIVLCGLPFDFKKIFSAQATCFLYKSLNIAELINGSTIKQTLLEYKDYHLGAYTLSLAKNRVLCYDDGGFWLDDVSYIPMLDSKKDNKDLFIERRK